MPTRTNTSTTLLDVAQNLVQTRGFNAFSYADISEIVGIRKASIHYHFPTKAKLGKTLVGRYREGCAQTLTQIQESKAAAVERLVALVEVYASALEEDKLCPCSMLGAGISAIPQEIHEEVEAFFKDTVAWIAWVIDEGYSDGSLACDNPKVTADSLLAGLIGAQLIARACNWEPGQFQATVVAGFITPLLT